MINLPGQKDFVLDDYPLYNLNRTSATYIDEMSKALKEVGMNQNQWRILGILGDKNPSTVTGIARRGVLKMSTLTRILDRMEKEGLIARSLWKDDKRVVNVKITAKGRRALGSAVHVGANVYERAFEGISSTEAKKFMKTLISIRENLNRSPYSPKPK